MKTTSTRTSAPKVNGKRNLKAIAAAVAEKAQKSAPKKSGKVKAKSAAKPQKAPEYSTSQEAFDWLNDENSLPGFGYAPILLVGEKRVAELSAKANRELTLEDVQYMVQYDGEEEKTCFITEDSFRPVKYLVVPKVLNQITPDPNKPLAEYDFDLECWGGAYIKSRDGKLQAVSGPVYRDPKGLPNQYMAESPLVATYKHQGERWPVCKERMEQILGVRKAEREELQALQMILENKLGARRDPRRNRQEVEFPRASRGKSK